MPSRPAPCCDQLTHADLPTAGPSLLRLAGEVATPAQVLRLSLAARRLRSVPRPEGPSLVVDIPGWFTPEVAMAPLRAYLRSLGHQTQGWGLGHNTSDVVGKVRRFVPRVRALAEAHERPVTLVGWSLGGLVAREVAREAPQHVERIVTIGAPAVGGPRFTNARWFYSRRDIAWYQAAADARSRTPIRRPITSIVSRRDGVIAWQAQVDRTSAAVEHVEVGSTHIGMAVDPDVWTATARAAAAACSAPQADRRRHAA